MKANKIVIVVIAVVLVVCCVFSACSKKASQPEVTTDSAVIKGADSIDFIKSYTPEELGIEGTWADYDFVAYNDNGQEIADGTHDGYYVEVQVGNKVDKGDGSFYVDTAGQFFISYDGKTLLSYDSATNTYSEIQPVHSFPLETTTEQHTH